MCCMLKPFETETHRISKNVLIREILTHESFKNVKKCLYVVEIMPRCLLLEGIYKTFIFNDC